MESRNIGLGTAKPKGSCKDERCPFHGSLSARGRQLEGVVVSAKMRKTAVVESDYTRRIKKYMRYEKKTKRIKAHNPACLGANEGDLVRVSECRPLSKTKNFVIVEILGTQKGFKERREALEESKKRFKEEPKEEPSAKEQAKE
nr:30S ribosomal protein S17P [uncultured archaeon]